MQAGRSPDLGGPDLEAPGDLSVPLSPPNYVPANVSTVASGYINPTGIAVNGDGSLTVTDYDASLVGRLTTDGQMSPVIQGMAAFQGPFTLVLLAKGDLLVQTDFNQNGIKNDSSGTIWRVAGGKATVVIQGLGRPRGLVALSDGRVFVTDRQNNVVSVLDPQTGNLTVIAGQSGLAGFKDGQGSQARFSGPYGCALLPDGSLVVADQGNHRLRQVTLDGKVSTYAGDGVDGTLDGPRLSARIRAPQAVAVDPAGNVYVTDTATLEVRVISADGQMNTVAGSNAAGHMDGTGAQALFYGLEGIVALTDGKTLYVTDGTQGQAGIKAGWVRKIVLNTK